MFLSVFVPFIPHGRSYGNERLLCIYELMARACAATAEKVDEKNEREKHGGSGRKREKHIQLERE